MLTRRDLTVALITMGLTGALIAAVEQPKNFIGSSVYDWTKMQPKPNSAGEVRQVFKGPTATLNELEMHVTTLNPGQSPHQPHRHPNEELIIIRQGTVETLSNGVWTRVGPGSVIFNGSNQLHGLRNVGPDQAIYHVINWNSLATPAPLPSPSHP